MLKIFVTGDNHIGMKYAHHEAKEKLIAARIGAFAGMVDEANKQGCSLFVITGDLFERGVPMKDIKAVLGYLSRFEGTVAIIPGNHDYYDKDSRLWKDFAKSVEDLDNIMLLTEFKPYEVDGVALYPALCTSEHSSPWKNNLNWIKEAGISPDETYRIGIAHGSVEGETPDNDGVYFPMKRAELENIPIDAWLIGHTHVPFSFGKVFNAGTHVQTDCNCNTPGLCFILEIDENKNVKIEKFVSGTVRFYRRAITLTAGEAAEILEQELKDIPDNSSVDLIISGAVSAEEYDDRFKIIEGALSRFIESTYSESALSKLITPEIINSEFAETSFSAKLLTALLDDPKEAQLAYELLSSLKEGK